MWSNLWFKKKKKKKVCSTRCPGTAWDLSIACGAGRANPSAPFTSFITAIQASPMNSITKSYVQ